VNGVAAVASIWLLPLLIIVAATSDVLSRRIPNKLTLLIALLFFPVALSAGIPVLKIVVHACCGIAVLGLGYAFFSWKFIGGGDAKLLAAGAVWFGLEGLATFLMMTAVAGGLLALVILVWSLIAIDVEIRGSPIAPLVRRYVPAVPYGCAIAVGALLTASGNWSSTFAS